MIPGSVPADLLLARTDQVAVAVGSVRAYPNGFEFTVHVRMRRVDPEIGPYGDPFSLHGHSRGARSQDNALRLGVLYADGRRTATTSSWVLRDESDENLVLSQQGGGGGGRCWDQDFWLYPLPPDGPVTLIVSWLEHDVTETRVGLDGAAIRAAAGRAVTLWPDEPDAEPGESWATRTRVVRPGDDASD